MDPDVRDSDDKDEMGEAILSSGYPDSSVSACTDSCVSACPDSCVSAQPDAFVVVSSGLDVVHELLCV